MKKLLIILALLISMSANAQWVNVPNGLSTNQEFFTMASSGNNLFAGNYNGVYISTNDGANWSLTSLPRSGDILLAEGNNIYAGTNLGVYVTTNNGQNWKQLGTKDIPWIWALAKYGDTIFAGCYGGLGIYRTTNNGIEWTRSLVGEFISSLIIKENYIFAGNWREPVVWYSTDNGSNWNSTYLGSAYPRVTLSIAVKGNNIFAGTDNDGVFVSSNNGLNWTQTSLNNASVNSIIIYGKVIFLQENYSIRRVCIYPRMTV